ncbi:7134_t:CDS:2, partial [Scutellospora calospora]
HLIKLEDTTCQLFLNICYPQSATTVSIDSAIKEVARDYLTIQSTNISCKKAFSEKDDYILVLNSRLPAEIVREQLYVKS